MQMSMKEQSKELGRNSAGDFRRKKFRRKSSEDYQKKKLSILQKLVDHILEKKIIEKGKSDISMK